MGEDSFLEGFFFYVLVLDRVQSFLPHMANANDELRREMASGPVEDFDIEHVDSSTENVIEMVRALFMGQLHAPGLLLLLQKKELSPFSSSLAISVLKTADGFV